MITHKVYVRQCRKFNELGRVFIPDQPVNAFNWSKLGLGEFVECKVGKYHVMAKIVGWGWEDDEFVVNVL